MSAPRPGLSRKARYALAAQASSGLAAAETRADSRADVHGVPGSDDDPTIEIGWETAPQAGTADPAATSEAFFADENDISAEDKDGEDAEDVRDEELFTSDVSSNDVSSNDVSSNDVSSNDVSSGVEADIPDFRRRELGRGGVMALVAGALSLAVASLAVSRLVHSGEQPSVSARARSSEPSVAEAPGPEPIPAPATRGTDEVAGVTTPELAVGASPPSEERAAAVTVSINVFPEEAVILRAGKRLGAGVVRVSVERNVKQRFTALLDGYTPSNFTIDGSHDSVTIRLQRAPKRPAPSREGVPEDEARMDGSSATTLSPQTENPPAENSGPPLPTPDISTTAPSSE